MSSQVSLALIVTVVVFAAAVVVGIVGYAIDLGAQRRENR
jgi:preprotein translocase subunit Sss1